MNKQVLLSSAIAGLIAATSTGAIATDTYQVAQADKEKCYGVAKKGANDCANIPAPTRAPAMPKPTTTPANGNMSPKGPARPWAE